VPQAEYAMKAFDYDAWITWKHYCNRSVQRIGEKSYRFAFVKERKIKKKANIFL
jgi:hypothetical protein